MIKVIHHKGMHVNVLGAAQMGSVLPGTTYTQSFTFTESSRYSLGNEDQGDWNKLFGIAAHTLDSERNSYRWAWRYDDVKDRYYVVPFIHKNDGTWYTLDPVEIYEHYPYVFSISTSGVFKLYIHDKLFRAKQLLIQQVAHTSLPFRLWYRKMTSYFGGNRTPDKTVIIHD